MDSEEALGALGRWSRWQVCMYAMTAVACCVMPCWQNLNIVFIGTEPSHHCALEAGASLNVSIPYSLHNGVPQFAKCARYDAAGNHTDGHAGNDTVDCGGHWQYDPEPGSTIVTEWNLVCKSNFLVELSQTILLCGYALGATVCSFAADRCGRKAVGVASVLMISLMGMCVAFTQSYAAFAALRFLTGIFIQGAMLSFFVLACELFPAEQRTVATILMQCVWAVAMMVLALLAYLIRDWRHLQLALSLPGFLIIICIWALNESIPWMIATGRIKEAKKTLQKAARFNNITLPSKFLPENKSDKPMLISNNHGEGETLDQNKANVVKSRESFTARLLGIVKCAPCREAGGDVSTTEKTSNNTSLIDVMKSPKMRLYTITMCYLWCCSSLTYYGLSLTTSALAGNPYLNFFLSGLVEIPSYIIAAILMRVWGRRYSICTYYIIAGVSLTVSPFVPEYVNGHDLKSLQITLVMIGKFAITAAYGSIYLYAPEIFPTTTRNVGMGLSSVASGFGNILSPFSAYVAKSLPWLPGVLFGAMAIVAGVLTLLLPETLGRPLPETIQEIEQWTRTLTKDEKNAIKFSRKKNKNNKSYDQVNMNEKN